MAWSLILADYQSSASAAPVHKQSHTLWHCPILISKYSKLFTLTLQMYVALNLHTYMYCITYKYNLYVVRCCT